MEPSFVACASVPIAIDFAAAVVAPLIATEDSPFAFELYPTATAFSLVASVL
mgnify:CR=1 FL=1